ncbi:alkaline ceramidase TOD1 [Cryptomeria japonica]|uniref:alkaline ceramidase TOD1 n=1 Tax=Cryptomeria japonica TaxID=3369 RepID=UPI0027D9F4E2|nr:alkaline ceramidase TOD1 [Cryptomeria japonica]
MPPPPFFPLHMFACSVDFKIPKLLLHRLFFNVRYSLWIDGKLELLVDLHQILESYRPFFTHTSLAPTAGQKTTFFGLQD